MYENLASFAQTWGMMFFIAVFLVVIAYAIWPKNRAKFEAAAQMPLNDDGPSVDGGNEDETHV